MKFTVLSILIIVALFGYNKGSNLSASSSYKKDIARCVGSNPCRACSNCSYCGWCNSGGTCGICVSRSKPKPLRSSPAQAGRCKATTQKGTRCSRQARSKGYCWQHGG